MSASHRNPFRWISGFQFGWIALLVLKLLDVIPLPWWALLAPIWVPLALVLAVEARNALVDAWTAEPDVANPFAPHCSDCGRNIETNDDAHVCIECGGYNRRSK